MKELKGHPNFIQYEDHYDDETAIYILLEKIKGCDLETIMTDLKNEFYTNKEAFMRFILRLLIQLSEALKVLNNKNIYHRDLHPKNIMLKFKDDQHLKEAKDQKF